MHINDTVRYHQDFMQAVFEEAGEFMLMAVLLATRAPDGVVFREPIPFPVLGAQSAEELRSMVSVLAPKVGAIGSVIMFEAWTVRAQTAAELPRLLREGVAAQADRAEALSLVVELGGECQCWQARIERDAAGRGSLGGWARQPGKPSGSFVGLLPYVN